MTNHGDQKLVREQTERMRLTADRLDTAIANRGDVISHSYAHIAAVRSFRRLVATAFEPDRRFSRRSHF